jgi:hypothetical protein
MLKTDGYAVSVLPKKPTVVGKIEDLPKMPAARGTKSEQVKLPVVLDGKRVVGVDPGWRNLVSCAWKDRAGVATYSGLPTRSTRRRSASVRRKRGA